MPAPAAARPLLLVLAHGVGPAELAALGPMAAGVEPLPAALPDRPIAAVLGEFDATRELTDLGVAVDRSAVVLRPAGRSDATAAEVLAGRPAGPADVTLFEARDVLAAAMVGGRAAAAAAATWLGDLLQRLATILRRGDPPELWFVGLGAPIATATTFDLAAAWRRHVLPPLGDDLTLRVGPASAIVRGANQRALDRAAGLLQQTPFARHVTLTPCATGTLHLEARRGVAFGAERLAARPPLPHEVEGVVWAPLGDLARRKGLTFADVLARFWLRAATLHGEVDEGVAATPNVPETVTVDGATTLASTSATLPEATPRQ